jgi:hypothetical protein
MKLADSWIEEPSTTAQPARLYDELDECDEIDESKDGCGGVCWWKYVLKKARTSNKLLHELAREVRGVEIKRGRRLTIPQYKTILIHWEDASRPFLRKGHDYFTEFLARLSVVTMPKGETLESAFQRSQSRQPPSKVLLVPNKRLQSLASLCGELQEMFGEQPIMLCQTSIAKLLKVSQQTISEWIRALKTLDVLRLAEPAVKNVRAARYYFIP